MNKWSLDTMHDRRAHLNSTPPSSPASKPTGREGRISFSSVREDDGGTAQTFLDARSPLLSDSRLDHSHGHDHGSDATTTTAPSWRAQTADDGPEGDLDYLRRIQREGSQFCSSIEDVQTQTGGVSHELNVENCVDELPPAKKTKTGLYAPGESPLERLPPEVLGERGQWKGRAFGNIDFS